jgi:hypothetical protein
LHSPIKILWLCQLMATTWECPSAPALMTTLSAVQHNLVIKAFYQRLCAAGKPRKVALCAASHKLLRIAWAIVNTNQGFDPAYAILMPFCRSLPEDVAGHRSQAISYS